MKKKLFDRLKLKNQVLNDAATDNADSDDKNIDEARGIVMDMMSLENRIRKIKFSFKDK